MTSPQPVLRDWLGWLFAVLMAILGALATVAWNSLERRISSLELYGATPIRMEVGRLTSELETLRRQSEIDHRQLMELTQEVRGGQQQFRYEENAATPSRPRFGR